MATRMCVEQGLHIHGAPPTSYGNSLLEEQLRRRVFWQCYIMDRYTAVMLDRPPAIADRAIQIGFPADADDEEIDIAEASGACADLDSFHRMPAAPIGPPGTTEMSVFFSFLRLRKITSKIHAKFQQKTSRPMDCQVCPIELPTTSGAIYADLDELLVELDCWRRSTPVFLNPKCLYERQEWYDLLLIREKLLLVRKAIDFVPKRNNVPPRDLLCVCLDYAVGTITTFCPLFSQKIVTYTRSYFQTLFTAGLSVMFCLSVVTDLDSQCIMNGAEAVKYGEKTLKEMVQELPDAVHYVALYEALRVNILGKLESRGQLDTFSKSNQGGRPVNSDPAYQERANGVQSQPGCGIDGPHSLPGVHEHSVQLPTQWPMLASNLTESVTHEGNTENLLTWDIFGDNVFWSMEAGMLGEYVYGDLGAGSFLDDYI
ncbi:hypothetical protein PHISCL_07305 [Aspergillus sclerotialis]|uniref:Xylanolytic transcriptional activator regulatory domain-containing protein n=1 Tax=Aspergillus sclerotialis TaxID=2070753 RepID=A0A3A2ZBR5_9EURO|nr:hypothetical protein PHISCL_07305 [Aspergillus sclerotialis]